ncbi:MAG: hypothetical protein Q9202_003065 [Teloschistes flavicans]
MLLGRATPGISRALRFKGAEQRIFCVAGEERPCVGDCGSPGGWEDLKKAFRKSGGEEEEERRKWYEHACANGDAKGLDPYKWDILKVNKELKKIKI